MPLRRILRVGDRDRDERDAPIADRDRGTLERDFLGAIASADERRRNAERRHVAIALADERRHAARRAVRIEREKIVAEARDRGRQRRVRQRHDRPFFDRRAQAIRRRLPLLLFQLGVVESGIDGIREHDDVAGLGDRLGQIAIGLFTGDLAALGELVLRLALGLGEGDVDGDRLRPSAADVLDQHRLERARPRPAADVRREIADGGVRDFDEDDVGVDERLSAGDAEARERDRAPVVGLELGPIEPAAMTERERQRRGTGTDREPCEDLAHPAQGTPARARR